MNLVDLANIETTPGVVNKIAQTALTAVGFGVLLSVKKDTKETRKTVERIDTNVVSIKNTVNSISVDTTTIKKQTAANAALLKDFLAEEEAPIEEPAPAYPPYPQQYPQRWGYPQAPAWPGYQGAPQMPGIPQAPVQQTPAQQPPVQPKSSATDDFMNIMKIVAGALDRGLAADQQPAPQPETPVQQPAHQPAQQVNVNVQAPAAPVQEPVQQPAPQQPEAPAQQPDNTGKGKK